MFGMWQVAPFWVSKRPRSFLGWGKSTHIGYGYGLALGAKLAAPERFVANVMGDAAFGQIGMEVETAARLSIPVLTVILNNGGMAGYEGRYPVATARYGFKWLGGDYAAVARGLGAWAERVEQPDQLGAVFERAKAAIAEGRPAVVEAITAEDGAYPRHWHPLGRPM